MLGSRMFLITSFGRVVWMMERAGIDPLSGRGDHVVLGGVENVARRCWVLEHHERPQKEMRVSFPGAPPMAPASPGRPRREPSYRFAQAITLQGLWLR